MLVSLSPSTDFELRSGERTSRRCLCGGEKFVLKYYIVPKELGEIEIEAFVSWNLFPHNYKNCLTLMLFQKCIVFFILRHFKKQNQRDETYQNVNEFHSTDLSF